MAHGAHGASGWVSPGNQPDGEHEGPGGASDCGIRSAERRSGSDLRRSKSSKRHVLQRAKRRSATPRPVTGFKLVKQKISKLEDQRREDGEALRRLEQILQGSRRRTECATSGDEGLGIDSRVDRRLSELECRVFGRRSASMEPRMGGDVGATSPQDELDEYKIVGPGMVDVIRRGDATASAKVTHPGGMLLNVMGNTDGRATKAGWGVGGPCDLSEQQLQQPER